jgi:hypothetical protein
MHLHRRNSMTVRRIPIRNAMANEHELLEGEVIDVLPNDNSVYVDGSGKTYDTTKGIKMGELPQSGVIQLPRTTWYGFKPQPIEEDLVIVGYMNGPEGCVPIYERRSDAQRKNRSPRTDALGDAEPRQPRRNWRARKAARATGTLELPDDRDRGSGSTQP